MCTCVYVRDIIQYFKNQVNIKVQFLLLKLSTTINRIKGYIAIRSKIKFNSPSFTNVDSLVDGQIFKLFWFHLTKYIR